MLNIDKLLPVNTSKKGFSMAEMVISTAVLAVVMLGIAGLSSEFFGASATSSVQLLNTDQAREVSQGISNEINDSRYIYPPGTVISLSTTHPVTGLAWDITVNTDDSVAILFSEIPNNDTNVTYGFIAYFLRDNNENTSLYQFIESPTYQWPIDTSPAANLLTFSGNTSLIVTDIDRTNTTLSYIFNFDNGITDQVLQGEISGGAINDTNALIKGVNWQIAQSNVEDNLINIKGLSKNVPRFIE